MVYIIDAHTKYFPVHQECSLFVCAACFVARGVPDGSAFMNPFFDVPLVRIKSLKIFVVDKRKLALC